MKKSYNPFKMWGSYIGAIIVGIFGFYYILSQGEHTFGPILGAIIGAGIGFVTGWVIHSLIRRFK